MESRAEFVFKGERAPLLVRHTLAQLSKYTFHFMQIGARLTQRRTWAAS